MGRAIVTAELARAVRIDLAAGCPQRRLARKYGLSLGTISNIAQGRWRPPRGDDGPPRHCETQAAPERCTGCGGLVFAWPCLCCELRGEASQARPPAARAPRRVEEAVPRAEPAAPCYLPRPEDLLPPGSSLVSHDSPAQA